MADIHEVLIFKLVMLLAVANGTPVAAKLLLGDSYAWPLDRGVIFPDGQPIFGPSKTWRGVLLAILATTISAVLLDLGYAVGALVGVTSMAGDLLSSFVKRRAGLAPSSRATGLDQLPESILPLLACRLILPLG